MSKFIIVFLLSFGVLQASDVKNFRRALELANLSFPKGEYELKIKYVGNFFDESYHLKIDFEKKALISWMADNKENFKERKKVTFTDDSHHLPYEGVNKMDPKHKYYSYRSNLEWWDLTVKGNGIKFEGNKEGYCLILINLEKHCVYISVNQ